MHPEHANPPRIRDAAGLKSIPVLMRRLLASATVAVLAGCATPPPSPPPQPTPVPVAIPAPFEESAPSGRYVGGKVILECAPFARAVSGVNLSGAAADWWQGAAGRYARSARPQVGAVLTFRRTSRLRDGHAAVVSRVLSDREIRVTQANWVPNRVTEDLPVVDVSPANDWSEVRVWWPPSGQLGTSRYPTWGFILPDRPKSRDGMAASMMEVIRIASSE